MPMNPNEGVQISWDDVELTSSWNPDSMEVYIVKVNTSHYFFFLYLLTLVHAPNTSNLIPYYTLIMIRAPHYCSRLGIR